MPPQNVLTGRGGLVRAAFFWVIAGGASALSAQELTLQRDYPGLGPFVCPTPIAYAEPAPDQRAQAGQLASDAVQAVILGELLRAEELLVRASELDPASAELAYRHARVLEDLTLADAAMLEYCRTRSLSPEVYGIEDVDVRLEALYEVIRQKIPDAAREAFLSGLSLADTGLLEQSVESFTIAIDSAPDWPPPVYNRAVLYEQLGRVPESLADYRRYLQLSPSEVDPIVATVSERIGMLEGRVALPTPSPGGALALGVVFPGMGQYYSGRSLSGTVILALAAASAATGIMFKEVTVRCLNPVPSGGDCPPGEVVDETSSRPYLIPALAAAGAVTIIGAIEAFVRARGRRGEAQEAQAVQEAREPRFTGPRITSSAHRVDVHLLGIRFR